jgi:hypothetical protein
MAYQPLYGTVSDNQGYFRHTSCLRGRVNSVSFWLNSWFGDVLNVSARLIDGKSTIPRPDLRRVKKEDRKVALEQYESEVDKEDRVIVNIDIPANKKFDVRINGVSLSYERLKLMEEMSLKRMDMQIEALRRMTDSDKKILQLAEVILNE